MVGKPTRMHDPAMGFETKSRIFKYDLVDAGGTELYIQELEHHIDELEGMIHWCIEHRAMVRFAGGMVVMSTPEDLSVQSTIMDCYLEMKGPT